LKRVLKSIIVILIFTTSSVISARAVLDGDHCHVETDTVIEGDLFVMCNELQVEGEVRGSILGAARSATVSGQVRGSIYLLAGELNVTGTISKDIHFGGLLLDVRDGTHFLQSYSSIIAASLSVQLAPEVHLPGHITNIGYQLIVDGKTGGEITFWGSALIVNGHIDGDVTATVGDRRSTDTASQIETLLLPLNFDITLVNPGLVVAETGSVNGRLNYTAPAPATIRGEVGHSAYTPSGDQLIGDTDVGPVRRASRYLTAVWQNLITLLLIGAVAILIVPGPLQAPFKMLKIRPITTFGIGLIAFILSFPIILIVILLSLLLVTTLWLLNLDSIAFISGITLGLGTVGGAAIFYFVAIYVARVVVAFAIGRALVRNLGFWDSPNLRWMLVELLAGTLFISLLASIPYIGWIFNAFALFLGLGAVLHALQQQIDGTLSPAPTSARPYIPEDSQRLPYFPEEPEQAPPSTGPGTTDLPEGFDWWGEKK
jgi:hypothetical protein